MKLGKRGAMAVAATGIAVLSLDVAALMAVTSLMTRPAHRGTPEPLRAVATVGRGLAVATAAVVSRASGDAVLHGVRQLSGIYGALLRIAPRPRRVMRFRMVTPSTPAPVAAQPMACPSRRPIGSSMAVPAAAKPAACRSRCKTEAAAPAVENEGAVSEGPSRLLIRGLEIS